MAFNTVGLIPGDAVTVWWVIFNHPENCSDNDCGFNDIFEYDENHLLKLGETGLPIPYQPGRDATGWSLLGGGGHVVELDGSAEFHSHLPIGDVNEAIAGPGLLDPMKAEIHLVIRTHGPAIPNQTTHVQLNSDWGGCEKFKDPCGDRQAAIFKLLEP